MGLQAKTRKIDPDVTVVQVSGGLMFENTNTLTSLFQKLLDQGTKKLILDLSGVAEIDRVGGASLIRCFFAAREASARVCIARASLPVEQLFKTTHVDILIPLFTTIAAACEHITSLSNTAN